MNYKTKFWIFVVALAIISTLLFQVYTKKLVSQLHSQETEQLWPKLKSNTDKNQALEQKITSIMARMTTEQKVAQVIQPEIKSITFEDMRTYGFGSFLNGASSFPLNNKGAQINDWVNYAQAMYKASLDDSLDGSTIPTMWATDAVHGHAKIRGATVFPHNIGLGAANNPELIEQIAKVTAIEVNVTGIDWVFAPTVAAPQNDRWGRTYEGYSEDPRIIKSYAGAFIKGMQGQLAQDADPDSTSIATLKHFVGDGGTIGGIDQGDSQISERELFKTHAQGYLSGLEQGAQTVMASFNSWHGKKNHGNEYLLTHVLKERLGFDGVVVGDWNGHGQVKGCSNDNCPQAFNAGVDIFMVAGDAWKGLYDNTLAQVKSGVISTARLDDAVRRVLRVKLRSGLFEKPAPDERKLVNQPELLGSAEHRQLARLAVRESLVLLKNNQQILPLAPDQNILIAGDGADNLGKQMGAWTISWQSTDNQNSDFPNATSIYQGIARQVNAAGGNVELSVDGQYKQKPDVAVVVFGEEPYAEGVGDRDSIEYQPGNKTDLALLKKLKADNIPVVSLFISGRPMWVNPELNQSDAFVAVWLPGSEGEGIADVILQNGQGQTQFDFKGKLSFSWPKKVEQAELNIGQENYDPLFAYGYGLTYQDNHPLGQLDEGNYNHQENARESIVIFDKNFNTAWSTLSGQVGKTNRVDSNQFNNQNLQIESVDKNVQEDARMIKFLGEDLTTYQLRSDQPLDLSDFVKGGAINLNLMVSKKPDQTVSLAMVCDENCSTSINVSELFNTLPVNQWVDVSIPLSCFNLSENGIKQVTSPFVLSTISQFEFSFSQIAIDAKKTGTQVLNCS